MYELEVVIVNVGMHRKGEKKISKVKKISKLSFHDLLRSKLYFRSY